MRYPVLWSALLGLSLAAMSGVASAEPPAISPRPRAEPSALTLFGTGEEAALAGQYQRAYDCFRRAFALDPRALFAAELGRVELHLGHARDAAEHLAFALRHLRDDEAHHRAFIAAALDDARSHVVSLTIHTNAPGAQIFVDGKPAGVAPLAGDVFVDEGAHVIEARLPGHHPASVSFNDRIGAARTVSLTLRSNHGPIAPRPVALALDPAPKRSWVPIAVGGALTGVAFTTAAVFGIASTNASDPAQTRGYMAFNLALGGALLGATLGYALWPAPKPQQSAQIQLAPAVAPSGGGLVIAGPLF